jgi:hypothetical protein
MVPLLTPLFFGWTVSLNNQFFFLLAQTDWGKVMKITLFSKFMASKLKRLFYLHLP